MGESEKGKAESSKYRDEILTVAYGSTFPPDHTSREVDSHSKIEKSRGFRISEPG